MKKKFFPVVIVSLLGLLFIGIWLFSDFNKPRTESPIDTKILSFAGESKGRGTYEYSKLLKETLKNNEELSKYLKESRKNINISVVAVTNLNKAINRRDDFYTDVLYVVEGIQDSLFRQVIIDKINQYKSNYKKKKRGATSVEEQLQAMIDEQRDLNIALSVLATLNTEKAAEKTVDEEKEKLLQTKPQLQQTIRDGKQQLKKY